MEMSGHLQDPAAFHSAKDSRYHWDWRPGGNQSRSGRFGEGIKHLLQRAIELRSIGRTAHSLVTALTTLFWIPIEITVVYSASVTTCGEWNERIFAYEHSTAVHRHVIKGVPWSSEASYTTVLGCRHGERLRYSIIICDSLNSDTCTACVELLLCLLNLGLSDFLFLFYRGNIIKDVWRLANISSWIKSTKSDSM
jgi:hypothetical protein